MVLSDGTVIMSSMRLVLVADDNANVVHSCDAFERSIPQYLNALRVVSRQPQLPRSFVAMIGPTKTEDLDPPTNISFASDQSRIKKYIVKSALTLDHLADANDAVTNDAVPVHIELALDAAESTIRSNYRSAIIFAAAAIESCAGTVLDREYDRLLNDSSPSTAHRRVTIKVSQHESVNKDPVYLALRNATGAAGSRFLTLLHESPLYLLGRSLKLDKPELYRQAHSLYRTRNSLAHTGTTDLKKTGLVDVDSKGAMTALTVASSILEWFGEEGIVIPDNAMVKASAW